MIPMRPVPVLNQPRKATPEAYDRDSVDWRMKGRLPKPHFIPNGKRLIVLQEPEERITQGGIIVPDRAAALYRPTVGVVIGLGTGYDSDHPLWDEWERGFTEVKPPWRSPFAIGDRIVWGRYHGDVRVKTTVDEDWWDEGEERGDGGIPGIIIHAKDVLGVATGLKSYLKALPPEIE